MSSVEGTQEAWLLFEGGKWRNGGPDAFGPRTHFSDLRYYYSNLIDYGRVGLCIVAAVTLACGLPLTTAMLLLASTLLDWVDGPVARAHNQCTIFGSGVDWLADILAQIVTLMWLAPLAPHWAPVLVLATAIEVTNCIFDFAITATGSYPVPGPQRGFRIILEWCMPGGSYTLLGTALWLAYPVFLIACCLDLTSPVRPLWAGWLLRGGEMSLAIPAAMYVWCELAYVVFLLGKWREPPRQVPAVRYNDGPAGVQHLGLLPPERQALLRNAWAQTLWTIDKEWRASRELKKVFWINLWQRSGGGERLPIACIEEVDSWARELAQSHYDSSEMELDGYGLITNPVGSSAQEWHIDYTNDYSTIFIPLTGLSPENALQYAVLPRSVPCDAYARATENLDVVDLGALVSACEWVSVRQLLAQPFSVIKMDFGAIHRGIANTGGYDRVLFWVSVKKRGALLPAEPLVQAIQECPEEVQVA